MVPGASVPLPCYSLPLPSLHQLRNHFLSCEAIRKPCAGDGYFTIEESGAVSQRAPLRMDIINTHADETTIKPRYPQDTQSCLFILFLPLHARKTMTERKEGRKERVVLLAEIKP